jgi:hydrogenase expression/formation protein HypE
MSRISGKITRAHGAGGRYTQQLVREIFLKYFHNPELEALLDSAILPELKNRLVFTTDSHVVKPIFFPGGNIGTLSIAGTVNDLAVCGARPLYLSCGFILSEGFEIAFLEKIVASMAATAQGARVAVVTGDTKVVESGAADGIYINTAGIGMMLTDRLLHPAEIKPGDQILVSGYLGDHEAAILTARAEFKIQLKIHSDCTPINDLTELLFTHSAGIRIMRDPTRGGLATTLNEFTERQHFGIRIYDDQIPIRENVRGLCEPLGFDPLYMANEGKIVVVVSPAESARVLTLMQNHPLGRDAHRIGEVIAEPRGRVLLRTGIGTDRILDVLTGEMLPRIC